MSFINPFEIETDEYCIWEILIRNDFEAFCSNNWDIVANDFIEDGFFGVDGKKSKSKSDWSLTYSSLEAYRNDWLNQSRDFNLKSFDCNPREILYRTTELSKIEVKGNIALVHKEFNGRFAIRNEEPIILDWISLFVLRNICGKWRIANFTGYLSK
jgi:hypothetical protein